MGTAKELGGEVDQRYVNHVEQGLSQPGGAMLSEMGANLALKFGGWHAALNASNDYCAAVQVDIAEGRITGEEQKKAALVKVQEGRRQAVELRQEENKKYGEIVLSYIKENYGDEKKLVPGEAASPVVGFGDRIEIEKNHLKKVW